MIQLEGLSRTYQMGDQPLHALRDVTETIATGEYLAIMGPSGSGKSTLLNLLGCLDRPSSGSYQLEGRAVGALSEAELAEVRQHKIGFVFQSFHLIPRLTTAENVALPMLLASVPREERDERVAAALDAVGLEARSAHRPNELSGGECQRVAIARATIMNPRVLLADEPTGNLDTAAGAQVMGLLERMNAEGLTLITVTHDPGIARRAQRSLVMRDGRIAQRMTRAEFSMMHAPAATQPSP